MITTDLSYGVHTDSDAFMNQLTIGRHSWKTQTKVISGDTWVMDAHTYLTVPDSEAELFVLIISELADHGFRTLNNDHGRVSAQMAKDNPEMGINLWYHVTDDTGSVSLATYQAPWDDVNDRIDLAVGVLMAIDPADVMMAIKNVDVAITPLIRQLLAVREKGVADQPTLTS